MRKMLLQIQDYKITEYNAKAGYEELLQDGQSQYWVHCISDDLAEWEIELDQLGLSDFEKVICNDERPFPRAEPLVNNGIYLHIPISNSWEAEPIYIHILMHKNLVITHSTLKNTPLDRTFQTIVSGFPPEGKEHIFLLILILDRLVETLVNNHLVARVKINTYIKAMSQVPEEEDNDMVMELKEVLGTIMGQCEENLFCFTLLKTLLNGPYIPNSARNILNDILDTLNHVQKSLSRLDQRLEDQLLRIDSHLREQTDKRLRILTVISSIFLPITFISGVYGMNFVHMPELNYQWAYFVCLALMFGIGIGMLIFFAIRGWFK